MTTGSAVAERPATPADNSPAARSRARLDAFMVQIEKREGQIETLLSDSGIEPRLFLETCRRALMRDPDLVNVQPASFIQAALNCAADGLVPDGRKAAIVRYKAAAQYVPMYQGLLDIAYRSGNFQSIEAQVVYEGDEFDFALGDKPFIHHKRSLESDTSKIRGAYAVARTLNGGIFREVMGGRDLAKVRAVSKAIKGPNADWPGEMARKAPVRRLWKYLPRTSAMDRVVTHDDDTYDQSALPANLDRPKLVPGFAGVGALAAPDPARAVADGDDGVIEGEGHEPSFVDSETGEVIDPLDGDGILAEFTGEIDLPSPEPQSQEDDFPGDKPVAAKTGPTLPERVEAFKARCLEAKTTLKLKSLHAASSALRSDLDASDPEEAVALDDWFNGRFEEVRAAEDEARRAGQ